MSTYNFLDEVDMIISVFDKDGKIIYINKKGARKFEEDGYVDLLGSNILDCHPEPSKSILKEMMQNQNSNSYFKGEGKDRRLIHQTPIYLEGVYNGYMEMVIPLP